MKSRLKPVLIKIALLTLVTLVIIGFLDSCQKPGVSVSSATDSSKVLVAKVKPDTVAWPLTFGFGRHATLEEIDSLDIDVRPDGNGLPAGSGSVVKGKVLYGSKCALCHGKTGVEGKIGGALVTKSDTTKEKTIGNYWPYASTVYDYINRAMPYNAPGTLSADEVYSLTAFLLNANGIIDSTAVLNAETLPEIAMPAKNLFVTDDRKGGPEVR